MTEHVQLEIVTAITLISTSAITLWRSEVAARKAEAANEKAVRAQAVATETRHEHSVVIEQVRRTVNGNLESAQKEIATLKAQLAHAIQQISESEEMRARRQE